jgi:hypothetical protein
MGNHLQSIWWKWKNNYFINYAMAVFLNQLVEVRQQDIYQFAALRLALPVHYRDGL